MISDNLSEIMSGNRRVLSKTLTLLASMNSSEQLQIINSYLSFKSKPSVWGLVGTPGAGKSTFINALLNNSKVKNKKIGILLIDPSHPEHGGSLLGDRVRLLDHFLNKDIFLRSVTNLGSQNGLNPYLELHLMTMSLYGFDIIIVESVGGGQSSTELKQYVEELFLVYDPFTGDGIQHLKSGVLDVANHIIISKADLIDLKPIKRSLEDSISSGTYIYEANLTEKNILNDLLENVLNNKITINNKLIQSFYKKKLLDNIDRRLSLFIKNSKFMAPLPEGKDQELQSDFFNFLKKNS